MSSGTQRRIVWQLPTFQKNLMLLSSKCHLMKMSEFILNIIQNS